MKVRARMGTRIRAMVRPYVSVGSWHGHVSVCVRARVYVHTRVCVQAFYKENNSLRCDATLAITSAGYAVRILV